MKISVSTEINATKSDVWAAIIDIEHCPDMISGIIDLTVIEQPKDTLVGLKWNETREMFGKEATETMWITEYEENEYYCTRAENSGAVYLTKLSLTTLNNSSSDNTLLTMEFSGSADSIIVRLLSALIGLFIKKSMLKMIKKDLEDIKSFIEAKYNH